MVEEGDHRLSQLPRNATTLLNGTSQHETGPTKLRRLLTPLRIPHDEVRLRLPEHQCG
jgi:alpha-ketoglutarate-dependent taurine dioxygenase